MTHAFNSIMADGVPPSPAKEGLALRGILASTFGRADLREKVLSEPENRPKNRNAMPIYFHKPYERRNPSTAHGNGISIEQGYLTESRCQR